MKGNEEEEAPRPRPLSGGIWTLFSWLRRTERSSSSESVTSVGSDRSVASFDFLSPLNYKGTNAPLVLSQSPLTDTYKKRLHERNLRRQHDRDLTLCRKYGLYREEVLGYDAFSLPAARRIQKDTVSRQDRGRRATSESIQRRSAFVPGKRRAPLPPTLITSASLPRSYKRKRPAPQPPTKFSEDNKENIEIKKSILMNSRSGNDKSITLNTDISPQNKSESEKSLNHNTMKEVKLRTDKGFLKQMFDNRKRNSAIDTSHIKLLPSISELDKQAAEIIEANKSLRGCMGDTNTVENGSRMSSNTSSEETWICTTCLKKYKAAVQCCIYCIIKENSPGNKKRIDTAIKASNIYTQTDTNVFQNNKKEIDEKKKLREMLKEMKDSLPKKSKHSVKNRIKSDENIILSTETPTLRIGSTLKDKRKMILSSPTIIENLNEELESKNTKSARDLFFSPQPSSSKQVSMNIVIDNITVTNRKKRQEPECNNFDKTQVQNMILTLPVQPEVLKDTKTDLISKKNPSDIINDDVRNNKSSDLRNEKYLNLLPNTKDFKKDVRTTSLGGNISNIMPSVNIISQPIEYSEKQKFSKDFSQPLNSSSNSTKVVPLTENFANGNRPSPILQRTQKIENSTSEAKAKVERIQLGNVVLANKVKIGGVDHCTTTKINRNDDLHTPLKISSLLNPLYCPKYKTPTDKISDYNFAKILPDLDIELNSNKQEVSPPIMKIISPNTTTTTTTTITSRVPTTSNIKLLHEDLLKSETKLNEASNSKKYVNTSPTILGEASKCKSDENAISVNFKNDTKSCNDVNQHARRRDLINMLEQAISKGDEQTAAEAAAKLAKLKLSCSVLSFSSQIIAATSSDRKDSFNNKNMPETKITKLTDEKILPEPADDEKKERIQDAKENLLNNTNTKNIEMQIIQDATPSTSKQTVEELIPIEVWIEDKEAARGPIPLIISKKTVLGELKRQAERSLGLEIRLQRWIIGKTLCIDDSIQVISLAGPDLNAPFYLCLVESDTNKDHSPQIKDHTNPENKAGRNEINNITPGDVYSELMKLEQQALVPNTEEFECGVCIERCTPGAGVVLRECIHTFCRECLADVVRHCEEPVVSCPAIGCPGVIQEREIRGLLSSEAYERWLARGLAAAESGTRNTFHCRTRDCKGWAFCEPGVRKFPCPVCKHANCLPCQAVHEGLTCEQYQAKLRETVSAAESNETDEGTQALLKSLISRGEALECPECSTVITKKWGCDWVKCSACKTEICWVTRGRRWGPGGKGDTSGGCKCGIDGKRCHPSCGYCH